MKLSAKYQANLLFWAVLIGFVLNIIVWIYTWWNYRMSTDLIPLHYSIYFGIDLIDYKAKLFFYPLLGTIIMIINSSLALLLKQERLSSYFLTLTNILAQIIIFAIELSLVINYY